MIVASQREETAPCGRSQYRCDGLVCVVAACCKAEKKGRTKLEVNEIIRWLTAYPQRSHPALLAGLGMCLAGTGMSMKHEGARIAYCMTAFTSRIVLL